MVTGGSASGKSRFAELYAADLARKEDLPLVYLALLDPSSGGDTAGRIEKHRTQRAHLGFVTIEHPYHLDQCTIPAGLDQGVILLEDMGNLCANVFFPPESSESVICGESAVVSGMQTALHHIACQCRHLIVVANTVSCGGDTIYVSYVSVLETVTALWAACCDEVYELVAGIPVRVK